MPGHQLKRPDTSSENEKGDVHCCHIPLYTKCMCCHTQNRYWKDLLRNEAHSNCMSMDASDASDEHSNSEGGEPAVENSGESSSSDESAVDLEPDHEGSGSEANEPAVGPSDEGSSSSEDSDDSLSQQPLSAPKTPPLDFPASPAPHEAMFCWRVTDAWLGYDVYGG